MADKGSSSSERTVSGPDSRREGRIDKLEDTVHNLVDVMTRFMTALNTTHNLTNVHQTAEDGNRVAEDQTAVDKGTDKVTRPHDERRRENTDRSRRRTLHTEGTRSSTGSERASVFSRLGGNIDDDADSTWVPSQVDTQDIDDLRHHLNRRKGGVHARLGPNPVRSQISGTNGQGNQALHGTYLNRQNDQITHGGQASAINQANNLDEVVRRAVN